MGNNSSKSKNNNSGSTGTSKSVSVGGTSYEIVGVENKSHLDDSLNVAFSPDISRGFSKDDVMNALKDHISYEYENFYYVNGTFPTQRIFQKYLEENILPDIEKKIDEVYKILDEHPEIEGVDTHLMQAYNSDNEIVDY